MKHVFPDPRRGEGPGPDDDPEGAYESNTPPLYADETPPAGPPHYAEPPEPLPERGRGCSWMLVFVLLLIVGVVGLVVWGANRMITTTLVQPLLQNYRATSLLPAQQIAVPKAEMQLQIYYIARGRALAAETRRLRKPATENERLRLIAQELMQPPSGKLLENPLPAGTLIRGVYLMGGIAYVDLSIEFTKVDNPTPQRERLAVYALVNSLALNNRAIQGVQVMIDGRPAATAWGWLDLSAPLGPDLSLENAPAEPAPAAPEVPAGE